MNHVGYLCVTLFQSISVNFRHNAHAPINGSSLGLRTGHSPQPGGHKDLKTITLGT